jgi:hypothetical protein
LCRVLGAMSEPRGRKPIAVLWAYGFIASASSSLWSRLAEALALEPRMALLWATEERICSGDLPSREEAVPLD